MSFKYLIFHYWKSIIITCIILYLSFASPSTFKDVPTFTNEDKFVHLLMYAGLTGILMFDFRQYARNRNTTITAFLIICILFPVLLGGVVEIIQPIYFPPRTADWFDWFSDITGVFVGWMVMRSITPLFPGEKNKE